jgi:hypothetical protein
LDGDDDNTVDVHPLSETREFSAGSSSSVLSNRSIAWMVRAP